MRKLFFTLLVLFSSESFSQHTYDEAGNLTFDGVYKYIYNDASRLKEVRIGETGIVKAEYVYNHEGQRIKKVEDGKTCYYITGSTRSCGPSDQNSYFVQGERILESSETGESFFHNDHIGSPFAISDENGIVKTRINYEPYGRALSQTDLSGEYSFSGKELEASEIYYFEARYLSTALGGFSSTDPVLPIVGDAFSMNPYQYANHNPLFYVDSSGEIAIPLIVIVPVLVGILKSNITAATGGKPRDVAASFFSGSIGAATGLIFKNPTYGIAAGAIVEETLESGIGESRLPTLTELSVGTVSSAFGGSVVKGIPNPIGRPASDLLTPRTANNLGENSLFRVKIALIEELLSSTPEAVTNEFIDALFDTHY